MKHALDIWAAALNGIVDRRRRAAGEAQLCHACKQPLSTPTDEFGGYVLHEGCAAERRAKAAVGT